MRYIITHIESNHEVKQSVTNLICDEVYGNYDDVSTYMDYQSKVNAINTTFTNGLLGLKKQGYSIVGFGASAKGGTLLAYAGINSDIMDAICDQTPEKIGKYCPGTGIRIIGQHDMLRMNPDYIVILAWNFKSEVIEKVRSWGYKGKFVIPCPVWEVIE